MFRVWIAATVFLVVGAIGSIGISYEKCSDDSASWGSLGTAIALIFSTPLLLVCVGALSFVAIRRRRGQPLPAVFVVASFIFILACLAWASWLLDLGISTWIQPVHACWTAF